MPSGGTHDRITLWGLPFVAGMTFGQTQNSHQTLLVAAAFLFSGLMFGPDLDIYSVQYKRWGYLRWIWIPYQKAVRHRSVLSHGLIIGTAGRVLYLASWLGTLCVFSLGIAHLLGKVGWNWQLLADLVKVLLTKYSVECIALGIGLELGAMSHSVSDWCSSIYKRSQKQRWSRLPHGKMKKRKLNKMSRSRSTPVRNRRQD